MKKIMVNGLLAMCLLALFAFPALATDGVNGTWASASSIDGVQIPDTGGAGISGMKFSSGVWYVYVADGGTGEDFGLATWNEKGTKVYASNAASSKIYLSVADVTASGDLSSIKPLATGDWASTTWSEVGK